MEEVQETSTPWDPKTPLGLLPGRLGVNEEPSDESESDSEREPVNWRGRQTQRSWPKTEPAMVTPTDHVRAESSGGTTCSTVRETSRWRRAGSVAVPLKSHTRPKESDRADDALIRWLYRLEQQDKLKVPTLGEVLAHCEWPRDDTLIPMPGGGTISEWCLRDLSAAGERPAGQADEGIEKIAEPCETRKQNAWSQGEFVTLELGGEAEESTQKKNRMRRGDKARDMRISKNTAVWWISASYATDRSRSWSNRHGMYGDSASRDGLGRGFRSTMESRYIHGPKSVAFRGRAMAQFRQIERGKVNAMRCDIVAECAGITVCGGEREIIESKIKRLIPDVPPKLGHTDKIVHRIELVEGAKPVCHRTRRMTPKMGKIAHECLQKMKEEGIIEPAKSEWNSAPVLVKKSDGSYRFCVDYRDLNKVTKKDGYPCKNMDTILDRLRESQIYLENRLEERVSPSMPRRRHYNALLDPVSNAENSWRLVVPAEQRERVLTESHCLTSSGHLGAKKTYDRLACEYWWPGMWYAVEEYCNSCDVCQRYKVPQTGPKGLMTRRVVDRPWAVVAADMMEFPRSKNQNKYLLVFQDLFTRWIEIVPLRKSERWSATPTRSNGVRLPPLSGEQPEGLHRQSGRRWTSERGASSSERNASEEARASQEAFLRGLRCTHRRTRWTGRSPFSPAITAGNGRRGNNERTPTEEELPVSVDRPAALARASVLHRRARDVARTEEESRCWRRRHGQCWSSWWRPVNRWKNGTARHSRRFFVARLKRKFCCWRRRGRRRLRFVAQVRRRRKAHGCRPPPLAPVQEPSALPLPPPVQQVSYVAGLHGLVFQPFAVQQQRLPQTEYPLDGQQQRQLRRPGPYQEQQQHRQLPRRQPQQHQREEVRVEVRPLSPVAGPSSLSGEHGRTGSHPRRENFGGLEPVGFVPGLDPPRGACFECHEPGHTRRQCRKPYNGDLCTNCGRRGVKVRHCPRCSRGWKKSQRNFHSKRAAARKQLWKALGGGRC
ncbi:unnamed protein product [Trichogramma brassicae]|uniref:RNA-directed DNA polymerase n=1 Tax=Trichogramma brassicae TaxID=86971 RepID=A0A6H5J397_9HYME|nr:unnamed protein product [Trichogramma brassicae]